MYLEYPTSTTDPSQITLAQTATYGSDWDIVRASFGDGFADKETFTINNNGTILLVYDDVLESEVIVRLSRSFDGGITFIENITINDLNSPYHLGPFIQSGDEGVIFVAWSFIGDDPRESDILFDKSVDYGNTWGVDLDINPSYNASHFSISESSNRPKKVTLPVMVIDDNADRIYLVWEDISADIDARNWDIYMRYSDDQGNTWSDRIRVNPSEIGSQWMPDMEIDSNGNIHIVYYDAPENYDFDLKYRVYFPDNNSFADEFKVSTDSSSGYFTRPGDYVTIQIDKNDDVHVVWTDGRNGKMDVYYATSKPDEVATSLDKTTITSQFTKTSSSAPLTTNTRQNNINWVLLPIMMLMVKFRPRASHVK